MTLRNLSNKEIKTINGGTICGWGFPIISGVLGFTLCTLGNAKNIVRGTYNGILGLLSW